MPSANVLSTASLHLHKPDLRFKRYLDPPWHNGLGHAIKLTSALILTNTTLVLLLAIISAATTDLGSDTRKQDQTYISKHTMLLRAELIFFYLTIPLVYFATNVTENWVLWRDKLRPLYVICAAVIAVNVWILQSVLWGRCIFASSSDGGLKGPGYCPYLFRDHGVDVGSMQTSGDPKMMIYAAIPLFLLYVAYLTLGIIAYRRERKRPEKIDSFAMASPYGHASNTPRASEPEGLPFRMSWTSRDALPKIKASSPDEDSYLSPKTRNPDETNEEEEEDGETTPSLRAEPTIALMLTTPGGTNEDQNPFDDDRLSRLGHKVN